MSSKDRIREAIEDFGRKIVYEVVALVSESDPDGAYSFYMDMDMQDHAECVEALYFE